MRLFSADVVDRCVLCRSPCTLSRGPRAFGFCASARERRVTEIHGHKEAPVATSCTHAHASHPLRHCALDPPDRSTGRVRSPPHATPLYSAYGDCRGVFVHHGMLHQRHALFMPHSHTFGLMRSPLLAMHRPHTASDRPWRAWRRLQRCLTRQSRSPRRRTRVRRRSPARRLEPRESSRVGRQDDGRHSGPRERSREGRRDADPWRPNRPKKRSRQRPRRDADQ